jgi:hypothetical protein
MSSVFWDTKPCGQLQVNRRSGGTCRLHLQGGRISQVRNQHEAGTGQSNRLTEISVYNPKLWVFFSLFLHYMALYPRRYKSLQPPL